jgi:thiamine pyrophosphokinase
MPSLNTNFLTSGRCLKRSSKLSLIVCADRAQISS